jgi:hypothetical protein
MKIKTKYIEVEFDEVSSVVEWHKVLAFILDASLQIIEAEDNVGGIIISEEDIVE